MTSTQLRSWAQTFSSEGFLVNLTQRQALEKASTIADGSSTTSSESLATWDATGSFWKTPQDSFLPELNRYAGPWPRSGTIRSGTLFALRTWRHLKNESESSSLVGTTWERNEYPTPSATQYGSAQNEGKVKHQRPSNGTPSLETWAKNWPTPAYTDGWKAPKWHKGGGPSLPTASETFEHWPTPQAHDAKGGKSAEKVDEMRARTGAGVSNLNERVSRWPTPTAGDAKQSGAAGYATDGNRNPGTTLIVAEGLDFDPDLGPPVHWTEKTGKRLLAKIPRSSRRLNPNFCELLNGLPRGWTDSGSSATASYRVWRDLHSQLLHDALGW